MVYKITVRKYIDDTIKILQIEKTNLKIKDLHKLWTKVHSDVIIKE